jgi:hypothetical protein
MKEDVKKEYFSLHIRELDIGFDFTSVIAPTNSFAVKDGEPARKPSS